MDFLSDGSRGFPGFSMDRSQEIGSSGIHRTVHRQGKGPEPQPGDQVSIVYSAWLPDGRKVAGRTSTQPLVFSIGDARMVRGLSEAVAAMRPGEKARFLIPADLAYRVDGRPTTLPAGSDLIFAVELLSCWPPVGLDTTLARNELVAYGEWEGFLMCMNDDKAYVFDQDATRLLNRIRESPMRVGLLLEAGQIPGKSQDEIVGWLANLVELQLLVALPGDATTGHRQGADATL